MSFIFSNSDIEELLGMARYAAERTQDQEVIDIFNHPRCLRQLMGKFLHVAVNSHFDPVTMMDYKTVSDEFLEGFDSPDSKDHVAYIIHELYLGIRSTVDSWVDRNWLYDISVIDDRRLGQEIPLGFHIDPIIAPRVMSQYSDLISLSSMVDFLNNKSY